MLFDYDDADSKSIIDYASKLKDKTFKDILELCKNYLTEYEKGLVNNRDSDFVNYLKKDNLINNKNAKGQLGNFLEKYYFGYKPNSEQGPDFPKVGIELKQTPIDTLKSGKMVAGERLSITNISYKDEVEDDFYKSHLWEKINSILLVHYLRDKNKKRLDYKFEYINLFSPPEGDLKIIIDDYNKINDKIKRGLAHELSESDTNYLGACTKGKTAESSIRPQLYGNHTPAKKRNFCFKRSYMDYVLQNYVLKDAVPCEKIISNHNELKDMTFEEYIANKFKKYIGKTDKDLCSLLHRDYNNNKAQWSDLTYRILGIKGVEVEEFKKANIVVKTIRVNSNGKIKENMSFPPFKFKDIANEKWEDSKLFDYFDTTRFLFVIFKSEGAEYKLSKIQFWNMPYEDLNKTVKLEWSTIKSIINTGVTFTKKENINGLKILNNFPNKSETKIIHVRPHAKKAAYNLNDGTIIGDYKRDANMLPNGEYMTTQSFWINNDYILKQINMIK